MCIHFDPKSSRINRWNNYSYILTIQLPPQTYGGSLIFRSPFPSRERLAVWRFINKTDRNISPQSGTNCVSKGPSLYSSIRTGTSCNCFVIREHTIETESSRGVVWREIARIGGIRWTTRGRASLFLRLIVMRTQRRDGNRYRPFMRCGQKLTGLNGFSLTPFSAGSKRVIIRFSANIRRTKRAFFSRGFTCANPPGERVSSGPCIRWIHFPRLIASICYLSLFNLQRNWLAE